MMNVSEKHIKIGSLVRILPKLRKNCFILRGTNMACICWFCSNGSCGIGTILGEKSYSTNRYGEPFVNDLYDGCIDTTVWIILFDTGIYSAYTEDIETLNEDW